MSRDLAAHKRQAGQQAAAAVEDGDVVGLGSGSTAATAISALGERVANGLDVVGVPTSAQAADLAREVGVPVRSLPDVPEITVAIDGADQVAGTVLLKGGGAAHTREKVIDTAANRFHVVVDRTKVVDEITDPIPVEILPDARPLVMSEITRLGGTPAIRRVSNGPLVTDNGNHVLDADFGTVSDPTAIAGKLASLPGVIEHGLFLDVADMVYIGGPDGVSVREV